MSANSKKPIIWIAVAIIVLFIFISFFSSGDTYDTQWAKQVSEADSSEKITTANDSFRNNVKENDKKLPSSFANYLSHELANVRENAALLIGEYGDKETIKALKKCLHDSETSVRRRAAHAILRLTATPETDLISFYDEEKDIETKSFIAATIALSGEQKDIISLRNNIEAGNENTLREILNDYSNNHYSQFDSMSDSKKFLYARELAPCIANSSPEVAGEINSFLKKISGHGIKLADTEDSKRKVAAQWHTWSVEQYKADVLKNHDKKELQELFKNASSEDKFIIASKLSKLGDKDAKKYIRKTLANEKEMVVVLDYVSSEHYIYIRRHLAKKGENSAKIASALLQQQNEDARVFLLENWNILDDNSKSQLITDLGNSQSIANKKQWKALLQKANENEKFIIALKLSQEGDKDANAHIVAVLKDSKKTATVMKSATSNHSAILETYLSKKGSSQEKVISVLLQQKGSNSQDILLGNWDNLDSKTKTTLASDLKNAPKSTNHKYQLVQEKNGTFVVTKISKESSDVASNSENSSTKESKNSSTTANNSGNSSTKESKNSSTTVNNSGNSSTKESKNSSTVANNSETKDSKNSNQKNDSSNSGSENSENATVKNGLDQKSVNKIVQQMLQSPDSKNELDKIVRKLMEREKKSIEKAMAEIRKEKAKVTQILAEMDDKKSGYDTYELIRIHQKMEVRGTIGEPFVYELVIEALKDAGNVHLTAAIPDNAKYLRSEPKANVFAGRMSWSYPILKKGEKKQIRIWLVTEQEGSVRVCCSARAEPVCCTNITIGKPKLQLSKEGPATALLNSTVDYKITVKNVGTVAAKDVVVTDIVPSGLVSKTGKTRLTFPIGNLAINESKTITVSLIAKARGEVCNEATAVCPKADLVKASACTKILKKDLRLTFVCEKEQKVGDRTTGKMTLENTGDVVLDGPVEITIPAGLKVLTTSPKLKQSKQTYTWQIDKLAAKGKKYCEMVFTAPKEGTYCVNLTIETKQGISRTAKCCTVFKGVPKLKITKVGPKKAILGNNILYTIKVESIGTTAAKSVIVTDRLPMHLEHESGRRILSYPAGDMAIGASKTFSVDVKAVKVGKAVNKASVVSRKVKRLPAEAITIIQKQDAELTMSCVRDAKLGERTEVKVNVTNSGDIALNNVVVELNSPEKGILIISGSSKVIIVKNKATWKFATLKAGETKTFTILVTAKIEGRFTITTGLTTKQGVSRSSKCETNWTGEAKLTIVKTGQKEAILGETFAYKVKVSSVGTITAKGVEIIDTLPAHLSHATGKRMIKFPIGDMAPKTSKTWTVTVKAVKAGRAVNMAKATSKNAPFVEAEAVTIIKTRDARIVLSCSRGGMLGERKETKLWIENVGDVPLTKAYIEVTYSKDLVITSSDKKAKISTTKTTWQIGVIKAGEKVAYNFKIASKIEGRVCVSAKLYTAEKVERTTECCTTWRGEPKLKITKTGPAEAILGTKVSYKIRVESIGTTTAKQVVVRDTLPRHLEHASKKRLIIQPLGDMKVGAVKEITIVTTAIQYGTARNNVEARSSNAPTVAANATTVIKRQQAEISMSCAPNAMLGNKVIVKLDAKNTGDTILHDVVITANADGKLVVVKSKGKISGNVVVWNIKSLAAGAEMHFTLEITAKAEGKLCVNVTLTSKEKVERKVSCCTKWKGEAKLKIVKTGPAEAILGSDVSYKIKVTSIGTITAKKVILVDNLPTHLEHKSGKRILEYPVGDLAPQASKEITVVAKTVKTGKAINNVFTKSENAPSVKADASTIIRRLDAKVWLKCVTQGKLGQRVEIFVTAENTGDIDLTNVIIVAGLDKGLVAYPREGKPVITKSSVSWKIATLKAKSKVTYSYLMTSTKEGKICVTLRLTNSQKVTRTHECCTNWKGEPRIEITKVGPKTAIVDSTFEYTIQVKSVGTTTAKNVILTDALPEQVAHATSQKSLSYPLGDMAVGAMKEVKVKVKVVKHGTAVNNAKATSSNAATVKAQVTTVMNRLQADLMVKCPPYSYLGKRTPSTIYLKNTGDVPLTNVKVVLVATGTVKLLRAKGATITGKTATWNVASVAPGERKKIRILTVSLESGEACISVTVRNDQGIKKNAKCCSIWKGFPALLLEVIDTEDPLLIDEETTYIVKVLNQGTANDRDVQIVFECPEETEPTTFFGATKGKRVGKKVIFEPYPILKPKEQIEFQMKALGLTEGDSRLHVYLTSEYLKKPVTEEESTHVY